VEALGLLDPCALGAYPPLFSMDVPVEHAMATAHKDVANHLISLDRWFVSTSKW